ncbi:MAG TPA: hypothetical protein VFK68_00675 [Propionibacteriaceae bacterium]|nr:hypothetical protein [Propionibacteriaceae bacterium]
MTGATWVPVPLRLETDPLHGGRWTSLRTIRREWLWTNPDPAVVAARGRVVPGGDFVDAGGVEECVPTVRGLPDHGDAWSRPWTPTGMVELPGLGRLHRTVTTGDQVDVAYVLTGVPGTPFVHAVHALLELGPEARLEAEQPSSVVVLDPYPHERPWPSGLDRLGPDDGTATCAVLQGCRHATVVDGDDALELSWSALGHDDLCSLVLWRNLRGWPADAPYRSVGIEPLMGRAADLGTADPGDVMRIGQDGSVRWHLTVRARERRAR